MNRYYLTVNFHNVGTDDFDHKLKRKEKPFFRAPATPKRTQRGK